jgi:hypothetical protein
LIDHELLFALRFRETPEPEDLIARPTTGPLAEILDLPVTARLPGEGGCAEIEGILGVVASGAIVYGEIGAWVAEIGA